MTMMMGWVLGTAMADDRTTRTLAMVRPLRGLRTAREPAEPPASAYGQLGGGPQAGIEPVAGTTAKAWGVAIFDLPVEAVWMAVNEESRMAGALPVSVSRVVGGQVNGSPRRVFEAMDLPLVNDRWWVVDVTHNAALYEQSGGRVWEASWTDATHHAVVDDAVARQAMEAGVPVDWTYGSWLLVDLGDRTLVEYYSWSDPAGVIPAGASRFAGGAVRRTLAAIGELAEANVGRSRAGFVRPDGTPL